MRLLFLGMLVVGLAAFSCMSNGGSSYDDPERVIPRMAPLCTDYWLDRAQVLARILLDTEVEPCPEGEGCPSDDTGGRMRYRVVEAWAGVQATQGVLLTPDSSWTQLQVVFGPGPLEAVMVATREPPGTDDYRICGFAPEDELVWVRATRCDRPWDAGSQPRPIYGDLMILHQESGMAVSIVGVAAARGRHLITPEMTEHDPNVLERMAADEWIRKPYFAPIADVLAAAEASAKRAPERQLYSTYEDISDPLPGRGGMKCLRRPDTPPQNDAGLDGGDGGDAGDLDGGDDAGS
ncbi:MAG: hypothetical protein HY904_24090 [Deltaproteobacteria bacterium]|nr:hypothetical protein [Deltaproteobacteria bacterium]